MKGWGPLTTTWLNWWRNCCTRTWTVFTQNVLSISVGWYMWWLLTPQVHLVPILQVLAWLMIHKVTAVLTANNTSMDCVNTTMTALLRWRKEFMLTIISHEQTTSSVFPVQIWSEQFVTPWILSTWHVRWKEQHAPRCARVTTIFYMHPRNHLFKQMIQCSKKIDSEGSQSFELASHPYLWCQLCQQEMFEMFRCHFV